MFSKIIGLITAVVLGVPIGGVYASADTPSKYLDRLTTSNSSSEAMGGETPRTAAKAVNVGHGIVLNTVDRNADRLEYVNLGPSDGGNDSDAESSPYTVKASSEDNTSGNTVPDGASARSIEWPGDGFTGESTVTYDANGKGQFADGSTTNQVTTRYDSVKEVTKYAHTDNVDDAGVQNGGYGNGESYSRVVTMPGASRLTVDITYQTEGMNFDWVCAYGGGTESSPVGDAQCSSSLTGKLGGQTKTTKSFTVDGDSVTFWFKSNGSVSGYYGYYAAVKGLVGSKENVSDAYAAPVDPSGDYEFVSWNTKADGTGENLGANEVYSSSNQTVYAQWGIGSSYKKWGTVGWRITDDGVLKIRPWEGDTGTTGSATSAYYGAPWHDQRSNIKKVESIGTIVLNANSVGLFYGCSKLTDLTGIAGWDVSNVTNMNSMFGNCSKLTDLTPLTSWNVSNVTNMGYMFQSCSIADLTPIASWNVSHVTDMSGIFSRCSNLTDLTPLAGWDVSNVTIMNNMFAYCRKLADLTPLTSWDVSKVTDMSFMFQNCSIADLTPLASWDVSNVRDMESMFSGCSKLTDLTGLASWEVSKVTDMATMFSSCTKLASLRGLENWNTTSLTRMVNGSWAGGMFYNCTSLSDLSSLANWDVSRVSDMTSMFYDCSSLTNISALAGWEVSNVTDMSFMFQSCSKLTELTALASWNVSKVTRMKSVFSSCSSLTDLSPLASWNVSNVTDMTSMFAGCSKLTDLTGISGWNVSKVTDMSSMFQNCSKLTELTALSGWNVNVTNMNAMFYNCSSLTDLTPISGWDVSKVTDMGSMFQSCSKLTELTALSGWNVSKVTSMNYMFDGCSNLTDLTALANWTVSNVTNMIRMFYGCSNLQKVGIPSIANGGQNLVKNASNTSLSKYLGSRIITEDLQLGPYTWSELNTEMTTNPDTFNKGHVWVRYTPSWIITYNGNGGVGSQDRSMTPLNESLTLPESQFLRFGYRFIGWTTQSGPVSSGNPLMLPGETYKPDNPVDGEKYPLYAQWEKIGGSEEQPVTGQSGSLPGWVQVDSGNTRNDILPNQSQSVTFTNKYDPGLTSIQFRFTKLMDGNVPDVGNSFQFELFSASENKVIQTIVNNGASVQFNPITYDKPGEYVYYVRESPSSTQDNVNANPSIDYDDHLVEIKVTVTEADDASSPSGKKLTATAQVTGDTTFRNDSKPASLDITKTVTGVTEGMNDNHKDREFTFNVNLLDRDNQPVTGKTYPITTTSDNGESNGDAASSTGSITFDTTGNATVKLKAGSKLTINGIPAYYKYTITETNIPAGYENISLTNPNGVLGANSHVTVDAVNHYTVTPASVSLQAGKTLLAPGGLNQAVNNGEFRFTLCQVASLLVEPESESNAESCSGVSETSNDGNGLVTFPQLTFDAPGTYTYQIREVKGDTLDMTYDSTVYTATVNVTDDGAGRLVAKVTYTNTSTGDPVTPGSGPGSMGVPVFVNRTTVANRLPVAGGSDIIMAGVILALIIAGGLFVLLRRDREEQ